ncbi:MAG TPA: homoserine/homoserine lactone efflux protein [Casimicrobiaceae bacterium]|nr:homoserine/homoserine lactone efflux protein [Casimicrobiaceae bacterium]
MPLETWLAFFVAAWLISLSPGAGAISCMATGLRYGFARAAWNIAGLILGILFVLGIVAAGLGAILAASSLAFAIIKWLGVAYLVWLGIQQWRAPAFAVDAEAANAGHTASARALMLKGFLVNASNPKGIVFMLAVLPQFIDPTRPQLAQYAICGATLALTDAVVMSGYTLFAARVLRLLREKRHIRIMNRTFGALFVAAGTALATFKRAV